MDQLALQIDDYNGSIDSLKNFLLITNIFEYTNNIWLIIDSVKLNNIQQIQSILKLPNHFYSFGICSKYNLIKYFIDQIFNQLYINNINQFKIKTDDLHLMKSIIQTIKPIQSIHFIYYYPIIHIWKQLLDYLTLLNIHYSHFQDQNSLIISFQ